MIELKPQQRRTKSREKIIEAATQLLSINPRASLDDIAEAATVGRATLFRHFKNKESLMLYLTDEALTQMEMQCQPIFSAEAPAKQKLQQLTQVLITLGARFSFLMLDDSMYADQQLMERYEKHLHALSIVFQQAQNEQLISKNFPLTWLVSLYESHIYAAWTYRQNPEEQNNSVENTVALVVKSLLNGIAV